ncbi:MAG: hypothetical protein QXR54_00530 [Nanopusillaceae archaeon]
MYKLLNLIDILFSIYCFWRIHLLFPIIYIFSIKTFTFLILSSKNFFSKVNFLNILDLLSLIVLILDIKILIFFFASYLLAKSLITLF